jgi:TPP-dependent 2-oxoacid decarboxylase
MKETIGNFLLRRLEEAGIRHIFGVPGDFNLELVQQLENRGRPEWVGNLCGRWIRTSQRSDSSQQLRDVVEGSDCLIAIGHRRVDSTSGFFTDRLPDSVIRLDAYSADVSNEYYEGITLRAVLRRVIDSVPVRQAEPTRHRTVANSTALETSDTPLTQAEFWGALQNFVRPGDVIIAEDGTSSSGGPNWSFQQAARS